MSDENQTPGNPTLTDVSAPTAPAQAAQMSTKEIATKLAENTNPAMQKIVTEAVSTLGIDLKLGKNAKHLANVLGHALLVALRNEGVNTYTAESGISRGAANAAHRLNKPAPTLALVEAQAEGEDVDLNDDAPEVDGDDDSCDGCGDSPCTCEE